MKRIIIIASAAALLAGATTSSATTNQNRTVTLKTTERTVIAGLAPSSRLAFVKTSPGHFELRIYNKNGTTSIVGVRNFKRLNISTVGS